MVEHIERESRCSYVPDAFSPLKKNISPGSWQMICFLLEYGPFLADVRSFSPVNSCLLHDFCCWRGIDEEASTALLFAAQVSLSGRLREWFN